MSQERKKNTVLVVSGNSTWYSFVGNLPLTEKGNRLVDEIQELKDENKKLKRKLNRAVKQQEVLKDAVKQIMDDIQLEREGDL